MTSTPTWTEDDNWNDMVDLLVLVAAGDRRTVGEADIRYWLELARDGRWPAVDEARQAIVRFRNEKPGKWLEPGHVTQMIAELRRARSTTEAWR